MHINDVQFNLAYSLYSWPNVVLPIVGGFLIDKVFGLRLGGVIFCVFIILGKDFGSWILLFTKIDYLIAVNNVPHCSKEVCNMANSAFLFGPIQVRL